jgi:hypothetical protein
MPVRPLPLAALLLLVLPAQDFVRDAIALGRTRDAALYEAFNRGYELTAGGAIERAEIVTEFRRAVLLVRERADQGVYAVTERDLTLAMAPHRGKIGFVVQARLHPLHTYAKVPGYDLYIGTGPRTPPISTTDLERIPMYAIGPPGGPLVGVRLEATFERADIAAARAPTLILTDDKADVLWQARIDLSRFR